MGGSAVVGMEGRRGEAEWGREGRECGTFN